jgi:predicted dehydrogenase
MNIHDFTRRRFLAGSAATGAVLGFPAVLRGAEDSRQLKIGLIGCGGRGTGAAAQALEADPNVTLWAVGDAFEKPLASSLKGLSRYEDRAAVPAERRFSGLDAYQKVMASGIDVVLLAAPPAFRPKHLRAAVEAGIHVFAEKPMGIDVTGVKSVLESAKLAKQKNVAIQHGYCWRFAPGVRALYGKLHDGELGRIVSTYGTYMGSAPKPLRPGMTKPEGMGDFEWQLRWWTNFEWSSGGPLLEQAVHTVDKIAWTMNDIAPIAAVANGGRISREDPGNVYDHYNIAYEYPGGIFCHVAERQFANSHTEVNDRIFCEKGTAFGPGRPTLFGPDGKSREWAYRPEPGVEQNMYQVCHNEFFAALRRGEIINTGEYMANSTMLAILGREAAHTGKRLTWEDIWNSEQKLVPDDPEMGDAMEIPPPARPGYYELG